MGTGQALARIAKGLLPLSLLGAPLLAAGVWSCKQALAALLATLSVSMPPQPSHLGWAEAESRLAVQRSLQQHFRRYNIYIPRDDIMVKPLDLGYEDRLYGLLEQRCGRASVYVWVPLIFRFPVIGQKVIEWCWKPQVKISQNTDA